MISISRTSRQPSALRIRLLTQPRSWFPSTQAAGLIGLTPRILRRRIASPRSGLVLGRHYRWSGSGVRRFLEINVPAFLQHLESTGYR